MRGLRRAGREKGEAAGRGGARLRLVNAVGSALKRGSQPPTLWGGAPSRLAWPLLSCRRPEGPLTPKAADPESSLLLPDQTHGARPAEGWPSPQARPLSSCPQASKPSGWL